MSDMTTSTIISSAIEHLRASAMDRSEQQTRAMAEKYRQSLADAGWDLQVVFPHPSWRDGDYKQRVVQRNMALRLTVNDGDRNGVSSRPGSPQYRVWSPENVDELANEAREMASKQYDAFIAKLVGKVEKDGPVVAAELAGEHVWGCSVLTVTHEDGSSHKWRTEMILNVSKLGTLFNQWPTRKLKPSKAKARASA